MQKYTILPLIVVALTRKQCVYCVKNYEATIDYSIVIVYT